MKKLLTLCLLCAIVFPVLGGAGPALTIQAEQAQIKTCGVAEHGVWNLCQNGDWGAFLHFEKPGRYVIRVRCYGSPVGGVWPEMAFSVDNILRETVTVATNRTTAFAFAFQAEARDYRIAVSFLNDAATQTEDRNLYIASLAIEPPGNGQAPSLAAEEAWRVRWTQEQVKIENELPAKAADAIETNRKRDATVRLTDKSGRPAAGLALVVELVRHDFLFGGNIFMFDRCRTAAENELYKERFRELFNYATTGFYWRSYEQERGKPDYAYTDKVVAWCEQNHIRVKGHPLLWACESGIPSWSMGQPAAEVRKQRVADIVTRYAGKVDFWEVVNEPSHLTGLEIDDPYRWAREANPQAGLIVNDHEVLATGCQPFFSLLQQAQKRGVPFDGIGIEAHEPRTMRFPLEQVRKVLDRYATLGKPLFITEFTPTSGGKEITGSHITGRWDEAAQADYATKFYTLCFAHPAVAGITWWDLSDAGTWLEGGGLLRKDMSPKPAYTALRHLIREQWTTRLEGRTGQDGAFAFRGFCGQYVLRITQDGKSIEQPFHLGAQDHNAVSIVL